LGFRVSANDAIENPVCWLQLGAIGAATGGVLFRNVPSNHQYKVSKMLRELIHFALILLAGVGVALLMTSAIDPNTMLQGSSLNVMVTLLCMALVIGVLSRGLADMIINLIFRATISRLGG
jgi:type III secretory pathway component EscS